MLLKTEEINPSGKILFINYHNFKSATALKNILAKYGYEIFASHILPQKIDQFEYVFIFQEKKSLKKISDKISLYSQIKILNKQSTIIIILINQKKEAEILARHLNKKKAANIKVINIDDLNSKEIAEKILWFAHLKSKEIYLNLESPIERKALKIEKKIVRKINYRRMFLYLTVVFLIAQCLFIAPLTASGFYLYKSFNSLKKYDLEQSKKYLSYSSPLLWFSKKLYKFSRPLFSFFYLALLPDDLIIIEDNFVLFNQRLIETAENSKRAISLILKKDKSQQEKKETADRLFLLRFQADELNKYLNTISQKLNYQVDFAKKLKNKLLKVQEIASQTQNFLAYTDLIFGKNSQKKYLLLFQNNMELRPGGGFIGSFGMAQFTDFTFNLEIWDVYEADGQLKVHVEPPEPIRKYLNQPHWFLRDSNFSADFETNAKQAQYFLKKELGFNNFDGTVALTTTAINSLLEVFDKVYLPDYNEYITHDNFYIKAQIYSEKNFFPGSIQKKSFLSSLTRTLLLKLEDAPLNDLIFLAKRSLDEKQIVIYLKDNNLQKNIDLFGWSGKVNPPACTEEIQNNPLYTNNCLVDVIFPIDANLGVNKANFFLNRLFNLKVKIGENGEIEHSLSIKFKNNSPAEVFPGGVYKNYFQIYIPKNSAIKKISKNGVSVSDYEVKNEQFKIIALYFEILPKEAAEIKIDYRLEKKILKGRGIYQLIAQKQIGSFNNDLILEFYLPPNIAIINQNFPALAKDNQLVYNTSLSADKIFIIELTKK